MKKFITLFILVVFQLSSHAYSEDIELNDQEKNFYKGYTEDEMAEPDFLVPHMMSFLGWNNFSGEKEFTINYERAILWNQKASKLGGPEGSYYLGLFYYAGLAGMEQDFSKAHKYWTLSAEQLKGIIFVDFDESLRQINFYNPNPSTKFSNLKNLYINYISQPTEINMNRLINLVDFSKVQDKKTTIQDFIKNEKITCTNSEMVTIVKKLDDENFLIQDANYDFLSEEEKFKEIKFARFDKGKITWFDIQDGLGQSINKLFGLLPTVWYYSIYFDKKQYKALVLRRVGVDINKQEFKELNKLLSKANKAKLSELGGKKHIKYSNMFYEKAFKSFFTKEINIANQAHICQ